MRTYGSKQQHKNGQYACPDEVDYLTENEDRHEKKQEAQMNTNIHVNVNEIPPEVAERIGCVFLGFHKRFQQSPELMAELEAYRAARHPSHKGNESEATP